MLFFQKAAESAFVATQNYDAINLAVVPGQNTPLAQLVNETYRSNNPVNQSGQYNVDVDEMIRQTNSPDPIVGYSEHAQTLDEIGTTVAEFLQGHIYGFKTQVAPMVDEFAERLNARVALIEGNPDNGAQVIRWRRAGPFMEQSLIDSIQRSKDVVVKDPEMCMNLEPVSEAEIAATIRTGSSSLDAAVNDFFNEQGEGFLLNAYNNIFTRDISGIRANGLNSYINGRDSGVAYALFVFLFARNMYDKPPAGCDMLLQRYTDGMVEFRNQSAQRLCRELELQEREQGQGRLVRSCTKTPTGETSIVVDEKLYREFIKAGGTNEALLGNALSATPLDNYKAIVESREELSRKWMVHHSYSRSYYEQKRLTVMKDAMLGEFDHMVRGMSDNDFPLQERALSRNLFIDFSRTLKVEDFECIPTLAMKAVCRSRFHATHAEMFLSGMARALKNNPDITPDVAADIAAIEYVSRWVASQMQVVGAATVAEF